MSILAIVGPTASGKSRLALEIAEAIGGEIVSTDSMAIYRGMDIGTAKPTLIERQRTPHHLIDVFDPEHDVSVAEFQVLARAAIDGIAERGRTAIVVGGSGLYVAAVLDDLQFPGTDPALRADLERECERHGVAAMYARLVDLDPNAAAMIEPHNARRIVRALEVIALTGEPFHAALPRDGEWRPSRRIGLQIDRATLDYRIAQRVQWMWDRGFVEEVESLPHLVHARTASRALGYAQVLRAISGDISIAEAKEETIAATRRFARRQQRWFEKDPRITWVPYDTSCAEVLGIFT